jgi:hypothetical protein
VTNLLPRHAMAHAKGCKIPGVSLPIVLRQACRVRFVYIRRDPKVEHFRQYILATEYGGKASCTCCASTT